MLNPGILKKAGALNRAPHWGGGRGDPSSSIGALPATRELRRRSFGCRPRGIARTRELRQPNYRFAVFEGRSRKPRVVPCREPFGDDHLTRADRSDRTLGEMCCWSECFRLGSGGWVGFRFAVVLAAEYGGVKGEVKTPIKANL